MSRLPSIGGDNDNWGNILNDYLSVSLDTDGTIKSTAITPITLSALNTTSKTIVGGINELITRYDPNLPLTGLTFSGQFNLSTNYEVYYNQYTTNAAVTPTIAASPLIGAVARVVFNAGISASLVATNLGVLRPGSDAYTVSRLNEILIFSLPEGLEYSIKVLN